MAVPAFLLDPALALPRIRAARERLDPYVRRTPLVYSYTFSESSGCDVFLKLENLQRTGSFKVRGALHKLLALDRARLEGGLIAASAGNHAQGVALAAKLLGARATIVMPRSTPLIKVQRTESYGAEVLLQGESYDEAQQGALELARRRGLALIHPFDDPDVILGQATVGLEIAEDLPELDAVVVPVGGGGLVAGVALAVKALRPRARVIGVQAAGAAALARSLAGGSRVAVASPRTLADGIRVGAVGETTFEVARRHVDECVTVEEEELIDALVQTLEKSKVVAETAGVASIAALIAGKVRAAGRVAAIVSGGNIDLNLVARMIESGLERAGRTHLARVRMDDLPGQLARVLQVVADCGCNVVHVQHYRAGWNVPVGRVDVEILAETRRAGEGARLDAALRAGGFDLR